MQKKEREKKKQTCIHWHIFVIPKKFTIIYLIKAFDASKNIQNTEPPSTTYNTTQTAFLVRQPHLQPT